MGKKKYDPVGNTIQEDVKVARELRYPKEVIEKLRGEPDPDKRQRILKNARNAMK